MDYITTTYERESLLLTQKELAKRLGVSTTTVRKWKDCPYVTVGKGKRYILDRVVLWLVARTETKQEA